MRSLRRAFSLSGSVTIGYLCVVLALFGINALLSGPDGTIEATDRIRVLVTLCTYTLLTLSFPFVFIVAFIDRNYQGILSPPAGLIVLVLAFLANALVYGALVDLVVRRRSLLLRLWRHR